MQGISKYLTTRWRKLIGVNPTPHNNSDTFLTLEETKIERRFDMPYRKTYAFEGEYIDQYHRWLATAPRHETGMLDIGIDGWMLPADALKLYEMAYFSGDILELGTFMGLSTTVLANAIANSGRPRPVVSIEVSQELTNVAREGLVRRKVAGRKNIHFFTVGSSEAMRTMQREARRYSFIFVDASHAYEDVKDTCLFMPDVLLPGGFCLFHDYNDPRNGMADVNDYGVYQAVEDGLAKDCFEFHGIFGCTGLFRRSDGLPGGAPLPVSNCGS